MKQYMLIFLAVVLAGCSTVESHSSGASLASLQTNQTYQLKVRTGAAAFDPVVYEIVYQNFSDVLPLREQGPYSGVLEVTFVSSSASAYVGSSSTTASASGYESGWYTGVGYHGSTTVQGQSSTVTSGTDLVWQNSTMLMVLRGSNGERLWSADYNYKGGWEMSGFSVNTPEEAARLVTKRLKTTFLKEFH